ncbi:MAG: Hpt domain-containing protein [Alphaproteobacteria bacterium]|nr:Hpt domain-containing protein [Alphaproteobacteria bacterium]
MVAEFSNPHIPTGDAPLFDLNHLQRYTGEDADLQKELLSLMIEQAERCLGLMMIAQERSDWRTAVHTLKGAARGVGAFALGDLCDQAEELPDIAWPGARVKIKYGIAATREAFGDLAG